MSHLGYWAQVALWCVISPLWWAPLLGMWITARLRRRERRAEWKADREAWLAERPYREIREEIGDDIWVTTTSINAREQP